MLKETSLAATLRVWRERLTPAQAGLPDRASRQTPGLRREELAELAGLSVDYLVRLEQGRSTAPSGPAVASLATALRLTQAERDHLYVLAGLRPPADQLISDEISPAVMRLLTRLGDVPVSVFAADWRQIWWSQSWAALVGDPSSVAPEDRNFVGACFPVPGGRSRVSGWPVLGDHPGKAKRARVADLRLASAQYPNDPRLMDLLHNLIGGNPEFAEMWRAGVVGNHSQDHMVVQHPVVGDVWVDCDVLTVGDTNLKIVTMTAEADSEDARRIERARQALLSVVGER
ncbi:helix-turn-helix transcriptional regulator [Deinococcus hopiensis]|nr:helix-turn-helix transcriptional regulator [Deinococcus hopiensis]